MNFLLSNPAGLWALLGIPAVLLIHFLQERSRRVRSSTLFLLEKVAPESVAGARFEKLRQSVPFWLQLLAVMILTWMLCGPRWIREDSRQTLVVVLDSSVSMSSFKEPTRKLLESQLQKWAEGAATTEWHLLETNPTRRTLYAGLELQPLLRAYDEWQPGLGTHDYEDALILARGLVKDAGLVIFVTDHEVQAPSDVAVLSAGDWVENIGFTGVDVKRREDGGMAWQAMVKNHGKRAAQRSWWLEREAADGRSEVTEARQLQLGPGQTLVLSGELPSSEDRATLVLEADAFTWDDRLPMQRPMERVVDVDQALGNKTGQMIHKMLQALPYVNAGSVADGAASLQVSELGSAVSGHAIQTVGDASGAGKLDAQFVVAEEHALTKGLNWMGLLTSRPQTLTLGEGDEALLWKGDRVLAFLRTVVNEQGETYRRLILNWDLPASNAERHPALLVMLHRFVDLVRSELRTPWAGNFECGQRIKGSYGAPWMMTGVASEGGEEIFQGSLPESPGFFSIRRGGAKWLDGAVIFADTREADFSAAKAVNTVENWRWEAALRQSEADPWTPLWMLALLACLLGAWGWKSARTVTVPKSVAARSPSPIG